VSLNGKNIAWTCVFLWISAVVLAFATHSLGFKDAPPPRTTYGRGMQFMANVGDSSGHSRSFFLPNNDSKQEWVELYDGTRDEVDKHWFGLGFAFLTVDAPVYVDLHVHGSWTVCPQDQLFLQEVNSRRTRVVQLDKARASQVDPSAVFTR
jgi:hypothetical protein